MDFSQTPRHRRAKLGWLAGLLLAGSLLLAVLSDTHAQIAGQVDPTFGASLGLAGNVENTLVLPSGKILVVGAFKKLIVQLNPDGTLDPSFTLDPSLTSPDIGFGLALQRDGKILVGSVSEFAGNPPIVRLNANGSLDSGFNPGTGPNGSVVGIVVASDGRIILRGGFTTFNGVVRSGLARLNTDGSLDTTFNPGASLTGGRSGNGTDCSTMVMQTDDRLLVGGSFTAVGGVPRCGIARLNTDGSLDTSFDPGVGPAGVGSGSNLPIYCLAVQTDGKIVVGGSFTTFDGVARNSVVRLGSNGALDTGFSPTISATGGYISLLLIGADGKIYLMGYLNSPSYVGIAARVARLNADGSTDTTFSANAKVNGTDHPPTALRIQTDGKIIVGGYFSFFEDMPANGIVRLNVDGILDSGFRPDNAPGPNGEVQSVLTQTSGKVLISGSFTAVNGITRCTIARLNADGSLDGSFDVGSSASVGGMALQTDGKVLVIGSVASYYQGVVRLNTDGSVDAGFVPPADLYTVYNSVTVQPDGKILLVLQGVVTLSDHVARYGVVRLNANGSLDTSFKAAGQFDGSGTGVNCLDLQTDGKIVIGGSFTSLGGVSRNGVARLNADGSLDTSFDAGAGPGANPYVTLARVQADGKILFGGGFNIFGGQTRYSIARVNANGSLDPNFSVPVPVSPLVSLALQADGKIGLGGYLYQDAVVLRVNVDGTIDTNFAYSRTGTNGTPDALAVQPNGNILVVGSFNTFLGVVRNYGVRLTSAGAIDPGFNPGVGAPSVLSLALQPADGKVLVGGTFTTGSNQYANALARLRTDGTPDITFQPPFNTGDVVPALALQTDGNIVVSQLTTTATSPRPGPDSRGRAVIGPQTQTTIKNPIVRCSGVNGSLDTTFSASASTDGTAASVSLQTNGQIVVGGSFTLLNSVGHPNLGRLNANGTLDTAFAASTNATVQVVLAQGDGHIAIGGLFTQVNTAAHPGLARLNADGTLDANFSSTAGTDGAVLALTLQSDGKLVAGGSFANASGQPRACLARFNVNGTLDTAFNADTITRTGGGAQVSSVAQQADGKLVIAGLFNQVGSYTRNNVARLNTDGTIDTTFDPAGGPNAIVRALALQPDGKTLLGGDFTSVNNTQRNAAARLLGDYNLNNYPALGQWRIVNFGSPDATGNAADTAMPYADGVANLTKYALNLNARGPDVTPMTPTGTKGLPLAGRDASGQYLTLTFVRRQAATTPGVTYLVEFSSALTAAGGFAVNPSATSAATALDSTWERVTVTDSVPARQQPARFVHLRVTDP